MIVITLLNLRFELLIIGFTKNAFVTKDVYLQTITERALFNLQNSQDLFAFQS